MITESIKRDSQVYINLLAHLFITKVHDKTPAVITKAYKFSGGIKVDFTDIDGIDHKAKDVSNAHKVMVFTD